MKHSLQIVLAHGIKTIGDVAYDQNIKL